MVGFDTDAGRRATGVEIVKSAGVVAELAGDIVTSLPTSEAALHTARIIAGTNLKRCIVADTHTLARDDKLEVQCILHGIGMRRASVLAIEWRLSSAPFALGCSLPQPSRCSLRRLQRIFEQARHCHRADAARYRRNRPGNPDGFCKGDISHQPALAVRSRYTLNAHVDDNGTWLDPAAPHHLRLADRRHHQVGAAHNGGQVPRARVSHRNRAILGKQQLRNRLADDVGSADDHSFQPLETGRH